MNHYVITINSNVVETDVSYNYCFFSLPIDSNIEDLHALETYDFANKPIYHLGSKAFDENIFKIVHNLNVKHKVESWLNSIKAEHVCFTGLIKINLSFPKIIEFPKEIYGTFDVSASPRNPKYNEYLYAYRYTHDEDNIDVYET